MTPKLIGFYRSDDQAQHAREDLCRAGFGQDHIHVYPRSAAPGPQDQINPVDRKLFAEAQRRGATAVMLDLDEASQANQALGILKRHHPSQMARAGWSPQTWHGSMQPQRAAEPQPAEATPAVSAPAQSAEPAAPTSHQAEEEVVFCAKRFASEIAGDDRFHGREWSDIEPFIRREFEKKFPKDNWDDHDAAIALAYLRVSSGK